MGGNVATGAGRPARALAMAIGVACSLLVAGTGSAQSPSSQLDVAAKPDTPEPPKYSSSPFATKSTLSIEYWTDRFPLTGTTWIAGIRLAPPASAIEITSPLNSPPLRVLVKLEFTAGGAPIVYALKNPIWHQDGKYTIPVADLNAVVAHLGSALGSVLPNPYDASKPLPLDGTMTIHVTTILGTRPADPAAAKASDVKEEAPRDDQRKGVDQLVQKGPEDTIEKVPVKVKRILGPDRDIP